MCDLYDFAQMDAGEVKSQGSIYNISEAYLILWLVTEIIEVSGNMFNWWT